MTKPKAKTALLVTAPAFAQVAKAFKRDPTVTQAGRLFGSTHVLKVGGKLFAMQRGDQLVVKLPEAVVDDLIRSGQGEHFDSGQGRHLKQWVRLLNSSEGLWLPLAQQAKAFVSSRK